MCRGPPCNTALIAADLICEIFHSFILHMWCWFWTVRCAHIDFAGPGPKWKVQSIETSASRGRKVRSIWNFMAWDCCAFVSELLEVAKWFAMIARSERERENTIDVCAVRLCEASNYFQFWFHFDCTARNLIAWIGFFHLLLIAHTVILFPPPSVALPLSLSLSLSFSSLPCLKCTHFISTWLENVIWFITESADWRQTWRHTTFWRVKPNRINQFSVHWNPMSRNEENAETDAQFEVSMKLIAKKTAHFLSLAELHFGQFHSE